ncbi:allantoate amidohydrolase [Embleya scabrispora]|uniref:allantoate amidohydrolase n=1 Tax=Embleya scabrispora TaxID=159449 RepID=UPI0005926FE6|nr:allantoate amidohydrolase [Embleya scabrispora]MYS79339.1 allantoate amidohydrolase [Streptomyces sp. SID5474]
MWRDLLPVGRATTGGYRRYAWTDADAECRAWFREQAENRNLIYEEDRNGNQWAWTAPGADAIVIGSHLDSVPDGGAYDGPLGVVSSFAALDLLRERGGDLPRPLGIVNFADEEGARFNVACVGSRLSAGVLTPDQARALKDADGIFLGDAMERAGFDPAGIGPDPQRLGRVRAFVELHVEQGRDLVHRDRAVGVASAIWPHGRWRFDFRGEANHAGTTRLEDRHDPMLTYANTVLAARKKAHLSGALATFGKVDARPGAANAIASEVRGWLDSRAADEQTLDELVAEIIRAATERADRDGVEVQVTRESFTPVVEFEGSLRDRIAKQLGGAPILPTGAGHDAGILSARVPTAMLFVRNPSGVSHSPAESAEMVDCLAGVTALADVVTDLMSEDLG